MKKSLTVTVSSVLAFLALNNAAHAQQQGTQVKHLFNIIMYQMFKHKNNHRQLIQ
ncbi:lysM domain protein [Staphylococcus aureus]|nr:lysM domain protein [Staphylococcus aureus]